MLLSEISGLFSCNYDKDINLSGVKIDSRAIKSGDLFVAIKGEKFDGHNFIDDAVAKGCAAILSEKNNPNISIPQIIVQDTLQALATMAKRQRSMMDCLVIALTGSNGKTTVKEMIANILPQPSYSTHGNLNNHIGVPLCALQLQKQHKYAVFELGANHKGEIAYVVDIVRPDIALINNIAPAHIGEFGSIDGVATAKGEIYAGLSASGIAVINDDDNYAHFWDEVISDKKVIRFSIVKKADIYAKDIILNNNGCAQFKLVLPDDELFINLLVPGEHNVSNALAAASCAYAARISAQHIKKGLEVFTGVAGRMSFKRGYNDSVLIDDTYNANLRSAISAIDVLTARDGLKILVFGDMGELGEFTDEHHKEVGLVARKKGVDLVLTLGNYSQTTSQAFGGHGAHYEDISTLLEDLFPYLNAKATVLVKGSRLSAMERIVQKLEKK